LPAFFASLSPVEFALIAAMGVFTSLIGGVAGYGTGALMPLVLVPILGAEPVVPIITIAGMFTNVSRAAAFRKWVDRPRALIVCVCAVPTAVLGAWGYTMLTGKGALLVIGAMMIASVVLRRVLKRHGFALGEGGLAAASVGWGVIVGGTTGAGIVLLSMLMAAGIEGAAVIATDATISVVIGVFKLAVFGIAGVYDVTDKAALDDFARLIHTADRTLFARIAIHADEPPRVLPSRDGVLLKNRFRHALGVE